jgi:hypothetical protein
LWINRYINGCDNPGAFFIGDKIEPFERVSIILNSSDAWMLMEFRVKSICRYCGQEFTAVKRFNDFIGTWEMDSETCEECNSRSRLEKADTSTAQDLFEQI